MSRIIATIAALAFVGTSAFAAESKSTKDKTEGAKSSIMTQQEPNKSGKVVASKNTGKRRHKSEQQSKDKPG